MNSYPTFYQSMLVEDKEQPFAKIECGMGGLGLIDTASELISSRSKEIYALHAKEECGHLLLEFDGYKPADYDYIFGVANMTFWLSEMTCDRCGSRGYLFNGLGTIQLRCEIHGSFPLGSLRSDIEPDLPFVLIGMGAVWAAMISVFYRQILMHIRINKMPTVVFQCIEKQSGKLVINFSGGDETTQGMVDMLLAYLAIIDEEMGEALN